MSETLKKSSDNVEVTEEIREEDSREKLQDLRDRIKELKQDLRKNRFQRFYEHTIKDLQHDANRMHSKESTGEK